MIDVDWFWWHPGPVPKALRRLRAALRALDVDTLDDRARSQMSAMLAAGQREVVFPPWYRTRSKAPACPRIVAGMECLRLGPAREGRCICRRYRDLGILDHYAMWTMPDGSLVLTSQPFAPDITVLEAFKQECTALGLDVHLSGQSQHFPGVTVLLEIRPRKKRS